MLLVDGNADLREATGDLLEALGSRVIAVPRADEALRILDSGTAAVDLIVADVPLAGGVAEDDGMEQMRELCSRSGDRGVVVMSSVAEEPALRRALAPVEARFLRKPFSAAELALAVEQALASGPRRSVPAGREAAPPPSRSATTWGGPAWGVAAGLAVAATGLLLWTAAPPAPPPLPDLAASTARRGASVELVAPRGEIPELPAELRFEEVAGAGSYRIRILRVDDRVLWQSEAAASPVGLPPAARAALDAGVVYYWWVEALDAEGKAVATSRRARFRVTPEPGGESRLEKERE